MSRVARYSVWGMVGSVTREMIIWVEEPIRASRACRSCSLYSSSIVEVRSLGIVNLQIQLVKMASAMSSTDLEGTGVSSQIPVLKSYMAAMNLNCS